MPPVAHRITSNQVHTFVVKAASHGGDGGVVGNIAEAHLPVAGAVAPAEVRAAVQCVVDARRDDTVAREQLEGRAENLAGHSTAVEAGRLRHDDPSAIRAHYLYRKHNTHKRTYRRPKHTRKSRSDKLMLSIASRPHSTRTGE